MIIYIFMTCRDWKDTGGRLLLKDTEHQDRINEYQSAQTEDATSETAIIEWYRSRESSVKDALVEMYLEGVSVKRINEGTLCLS
jgi:transposase-like protein